MDTTFFSAMNCVEEGQGLFVCGAPLPPREPLRFRQDSAHLSIDPTTAWLLEYSPARPFVPGDLDSWRTTVPFIDDQIPLAPWSAQGSVLPFNAQFEPYERLFQSQLPATPLLDTLSALGLRGTLDAEYASLLDFRNVSTARNAFNCFEWDGGRSRGPDSTSADLKLESTGQSLYVWTPEHLRPSLPKADVASGYDMVPDGFDIMADGIESFFPEALASEPQDSKWATENADILLLLEESEFMTHRSTECTDAQDASLLPDLFCDSESVELFDRSAWTEQNVNILKQVFRTCYHRGICVNGCLSLLQNQEHLDISSAEAVLPSFECERLASLVVADTCDDTLSFSFDMPDSEAYIHALLDAGEYCTAQQTPCPERSRPLGGWVSDDCWTTSFSQYLELPEHRLDIDTIPTDLNIFEEPTPSPAPQFKSIGASPSLATIVGSSSGSGSGTSTTTLPKSKSRRRFHRRRYTESSYCVLPPGADIDKVVSLARPFRKEGVCRWDGCSASIGLSVKEVWAHMKNAHDISEWSRTQSGLCLWPSCANGHGKIKQTKRLKPGALLVHLRAVHLMAYEVACPYCPGDKKPFSNRSNLKKHLLRGRPYAPWARNQAEAGNMDK